MNAAAYPPWTPNIEKEALWNQIEVTIEFKLGDCADCFRKFDEPPTENAKWSLLDLSYVDQKTVNQLATYVKLVNQAQYRVHLFQILICDGVARILLWDQSGCIFTEPIDYRSSSIATKRCHPRNADTIPDLR